MPEHVTLRIPKPRLTVYGVLVTAMVLWGAYSLFWRKPTAPPQRAVLAARAIIVPSSAALQRAADCLPTGAIGSVRKTLTAAASESVNQATRKMNALNACAGQAKSAPAATGRTTNPTARRSGGP